MLSLVSKSLATNARRAVAARSISTTSAAFERTTGELKFFSEQRKYGFIAKQDGEGDIFFHIKGLRTFQYASDIQWDEGMVLEFECVENPQGKTYAVDITAENGELLPVKVIHNTHF